jgi:hypothetical protein
MQIFNYFHIIKDGPYHEALHNVLGAYACYNTTMGYVSFKFYFQLIFISQALNLKL